MEDWKVGRLKNWVVELGWRMDVAGFMLELVRVRLRLKGNDEGLAS